MCICYKWEWNAHADRMMNINSAKLKRYYYFHAEFLEEIRYIIGRERESIILAVQTHCGYPCYIYFQTINFLI